MPVAPTFPTFFYGTAWKEDRTEALVREALAIGFTAIDTANQRRHYHEAGVGAGIAAYLSDGRSSRDRLFLQTKFTHVTGQDSRLPYDPRADVGVQVEQSFAKSLEHLRTDYVDSYVLHGPSANHGLADEDWKAWRAMETIAKSGRARFLGISNVSWSQLEELTRSAEIPPTFVQNRCYRRKGWDHEVRDVCRERGLHYQGFWLLSANPEVLAHSHVKALARRFACTTAQVVYRFALGLGMIALSGTTAPEHMRECLAAAAIDLDASEIARIAAI
jgi:diketogulonate reductase-like aldo/keto reductase